MSYSNDLFDELQKLDEALKSNSQKKKKKPKTAEDTFYENVLAEMKSGGRSYKDDDEDEFVSTVGTMGGENDLAPLLSRDEIIAPIKTTTSKQKEEKAGKGVFQEGNKWYQGWVDKGALEDGYQFGDISKIVLGTMNDNRETVTKAVIDATENLVDAGAIATGTVGRMFSKDFQQDAYDFAAKDLFKSQETSEKIMRGLNWIDPIGVATNLLVDDTEEASVMGDKSDGMLESMAHMAGSAALGRLGVPTWLTQGINAFSPAFEEAKEAGATDTQAAVNAGVAAVAEVLIEKLSGGIVSGTGADDLFLKPIVNKISNKFVAGLVKFGGKTALEGVEEVATEFATDVSKRLTYDKEVFQSEDVFDRYVTTFLSGAFMGMGGNAVDVANTNAAGRNYATGMTDAEFSVVDKLVNDEVAKREANGKKVSQYQKNKIEAEIIEKMENGTIKVEEIEEILGGDSYNTYSTEWNNLKSTDDYKALEKAVKGEEMLPALQKEYDDLHKMKRGEMTGEQIDLETSLKSQIDAIKSNKSDDLFAKLAPEANRVRQLRDNMRGEVITKVGESRLAESYRELERSKQAYAPDMTKYTNENAKKTVQNIIDSGLGNNSNAFRSKVDLLAKVSADTGVTYTLTKNKNLVGTEHYKIGYTTHGFIDDNGNIVINMDSDRLVATTAGHEVGHEFQKAGLDKKYSAILRDYCISKEGLKGYNQRIAEAEEAYRGKKNTTAEIEVANDLLGEYIFNDENFIKHLSTADRNVFQKVYDTIKYMCKIATAGSEEKRLLEKAKHEFEKAWREISKVKNTNVKTDVDTEGAMIDPENDSDLDYESPMKYSVSVTDPELIDFLENQEHITTYKAMVLIDGKLYPPMASKVKGEDGKYHMTNPRELGEWMQAEEDTTNIKFNDKGIGYYDLKKDDGGTVRAAYNPYEHSSNLVLNDQFEAAYKRDNLVTVECVVPVSEMDGAYKAEYAKDSTGMMDWHSGVVAGKLTDNKRSVYLSRYLKATRILSDAEVAQKYKEIVGDIPVPFNVVSPGLLTELENVGVNIDYDGSPQYQYLQRKAAEKEAKKDVKYSISEIVDENNNSYGVGVHLDSTLLDTLSPDERIDMVKEYVKELGGESFTAYDSSGNAVDIMIAKPGAKFKNKNGRRVPVTKDLTNKRIGSEVKQEAIALVDELILTAEYDTSKAPQYPHGWLDNNGQNNWEYWTTYIQDKNNTIWEATLNVANSANGEKILYDISPIKKVGRSIKLDTLPTDTKVAQEGEKVKHEYSMSKADDQYMEAVNNNDMDTLEKLVDESAKAAGYDIKAYHGTGYDFTVFDKSKQGDNYQDWGRLGKGFYFAPDSRSAKDWAELSRGNLNKVMPVYLRSENMLDSFEALPDNLKDTIPENWEGLTRRFAEKYAYNYIEYMQEFGYDVQKILKDKGYDGINGHVEFVVFDPEQVKSADPVTYAEDGSVIPLSERFNQKNDDIRFSVSKTSNERNSPFIESARDLTFHDPLDDFAPVRDDIDSERREAFDALTDADVPPVLGVTPEKEITTVEERVQARIQNTQTELDNNRAYREQSYMDYDEEIAGLQAEYDSLKNKNTIKANNLLRRIERAKRMRGNIDADYAKRISDLEKRLEKYQSPEYKRSEQRRAKYDEYKTMWEEMLGDTSTWKDKALGLSYKTTTMRRFLRDVVRDEYGKKDFAKADEIYDELETKYDHHEAQLKRESGKLKESFFNLKLNKHEDTYAHMVGEFRHNPETTLTQEMVDDYYDKHKNSINKAKVDHAIEEARNTFDSLIVRVNEVLREQGMKEIPYRKGYFPHFQNPKQGFLGKLLNWKKVDTEIPTSIAGLTENFNPERSWQSFNKQRKGDSTDYSLYQGLDTYIHGALDWIYHIEDIQKRRSLENYIRYIHSEEGVQARIDEIRANETYDADEAQAQIELVLDEASNPLNNLVTELRRRTNTLANKKASGDRKWEEDTNRKIYSTMTNINNRVNANMVVGSFSSALTNFIPIVQSWHQVSPFYTVRGIGDLVRSAVKDDGMIAKSDFLTNRLIEEEKLYQTGWDKIADKATFMMNVIDNITSQTVWRSKYLQNKHEGMSESQAIKDADQFAKNLIAGRSRGNMPTIFDEKNPFTKIFTAFQLEVANQYGFMFKDTPQDSKNAVRLVKGYATAFMGAYLYNALYSSITGRDAAFDPIGIIEDLLRDLGIGDDEEKEETKDVILNFADNVVDELPFIGSFTGGGRVPISSAMPYDGIGAAFEGIVTDVSEEDYKSIAKEMLNPLYYLIMPVGGGQIKKTVEGLSMFSDDHPVAGSYTDSGALRFPVEDTFGNKVKAAMFGQWSSKNARDYIENGRKPLSEDQLQEYIDLEMPIQDYWAYRDGLKKQETLEDKFNYIDSLDVSTEQKNIMINNVVDRKEQVDMERYDEMGDYEEFDFYSKNPEKYEFLEKNGISYKDYTADEDTKEYYDNIYSWVKNNPNKVTVAKAVTNDVIQYKSYTSALDEIRADKDSKGNSISGSAKEKKKDYIFSLDLDEGQKYILFKTEYPKDDTYNYEIIDYLNSRDDISYEEMNTILRELGFTILDDGVTITWD